MSKPMHFYVVFNPLLNDQESLYRTQAHEFYYQLKQRVKHTDKPYLYWGKLKVNEQEEQEMSTYEQVIRANSDSGDHTYLYITDYHHFWVAKVETVQKHIGSHEDTLPFYEGKEVSTWFKIVDMDLISAEFNETGHYIYQLYVNNEYENMKVNNLSPYVGGLHFPLIVQDQSRESYFSLGSHAHGPRVLFDNELIKNPQLVDEVKYQVNSFVLPPHVYKKLSHSTKSALMNIETKISKQKDFNNELCFSIFKTYSEILEGVVSDFVGGELKKEFGSCLYINTSGTEFFDHQVDGCIKLFDYKGQISLNTISKFMAFSQQFGNLSYEHLKNSQHDILSFYQRKVQPFMDKFEVVPRLESIKNDPAFEFNIKQREAFDFRNYILGVGSKGIINQLYRLIYENENYNLKKSA